MYLVHKPGSSLFTWFYTLFRANGVSLGSISGRVGGVLFPFVLDLKDYIGEGGEWLPMAIFGALAIGK